MKKMIYMVLAACILFATGACAARDNEKHKDMKQENKILVAYFSAQGHTKAVAEKIALTTGGDLFEIVPEIPYSEADLDGWNDSARGTIESRDRSTRPKVASKIDDISRYDTIYLGFPIWWYTAPTIVNTFLEAYDTAGKVIIPFATSGGSGYGNTEKDLRISAPNAIFKKGIVINGWDDKAIKQWTENALK